MVSDTNVFTGGSSRLKEPLEEAILNSERVDIITSFTKISGVNEIKDTLLQAVNKGIRIRFLTGTYLNITDPNAISMLKELCGDSICVRFYNGTNSFHPKAYFTYSNEGNSLFIGSSNLSSSALVDGLEWNYRIDESEDPESFEKFRNEFERLFCDDRFSFEATDECIRAYRKAWNPPQFGEWNIAAGMQKGSSKSKLFEKNEMQMQALFNLKNSREEGMNKALVVAATGTGKTALAAFDSIGFKRILFIAHTKDILTQACKTFRNIRGCDSFGYCFDGSFDIEKEMVFSTIQSLSQEARLLSISEDHFDYVVVDEFHHAAADSYRKVLSYLKPKFLLGLTATPERLDNKDVFILCDYNVVFEIGLKEAIERHYLCTFRYYGIFDDTDYSGIRYLNGKYVEGELSRALSNEKRAKLVFDNYQKYGPERTLGFCSSVEHAEFMANYFSEKGISSVVVSSRVTEHYMERQEAVESIKERKISVIFSVEMFNEGVDIPSLDMVMFLRPTESYAVFVQQLGRGLRIYPEKNHLVVLDFIGNYKNANKIPQMLTGVSGIKRTVGDVNKLLPKDCVADFDLKVIDCFREMDKRSVRKKQLLDEEFERVRSELGHVPTRCEFFKSMDPYVWGLVRGGIDNPFKHYLDYLNEKDLLTPIQKTFMENEAYGFINMIEKTSMSKLYKMPLLLSFFDNDKIILEPDEERIVESFKSFFSRDNNMIDLANIKKQYDPQNNEGWISLAKKDPIKFFCKSTPEYFSDNNGLIKLSSELKKFDGVQAFFDEVMDCIEYRTIDYKQNRYNERYHDGIQ